MRPNGWRRAVFLDRDGTLIEERNYLSSLEEVRWLPGAVEGLRLLQSRRFALVVVTNQSGVARGYFPRRFVEETHRVMDRYLRRRGIEVAGWYFCPHHPEAGAPPLRRRCRCRKPAPGMVERAARELGLRLRGSFLVGDSPADLECGRRSGLIPLLVRTGHGPSTLARLREAGRMVVSFPDLLRAARWICRTSVAAP